MITVPRYTDPTVVTQAAPAPQAQGLSPDAFGAGLGQGIAQAGAAAMDVATQMQTLANQKAMYNARTALDAAQNKTLLGETDENGVQQEGFLSLKGDDPLNYHDAYKEDLQGKIDDIKATLPNDHVRQAFDMMAQERLTQIDGMMMRHSNEQFIASTDTARQTAMDSSLKNIGNYWNNDKMFSNELGVLRELTQQDVESKGMADEDQNPGYLKARIDLVTAAANHERMNRMVLVAPMQANSYLMDHKDEFTSDDIAHFEGLLKPKVDAIATHQASDSIWSTLGPKNDYDPINIDAMQEKARAEISNPDILRETITDLQQRMNTRLEGEKQRATSAEAVIWKAQASGTPLAQLMQMPEWGQMPGADQGRIKQTITTWVNTQQREVRAEQRADRQERRQDYIEKKLAVQEQWNLNYMHYNQDPEALASMSSDQFATLYPQLGAANFKALEANRAKLTSPQALATAQVGVSTFNSIMAQAGITSKSDQKQYYDEAQHFVVMQQQEAGRKFTPDEIRKSIIAGITNVQVNQRVSPLWSDTLSYTSSTTKRRMEVEDPNAIIIPPDSLAKVNSVLKAGRVTITPQRQRMIYDQLLGQGTPQGVR